MSGCMSWWENRMGGSSLVIDDNITILTMFWWKYDDMTIYEDVSTLYWWKKREPKNTDQILLQKDFGLGDRTTEEFSFSNLRSYNVLGVKYSNLLGIVPIAVLSFVRRYFTIVIFSPSRLIWNHLVLVPHLDHSDGRGHLDILPDNGGKYREHGTKDKFTQRRWE